MLLLASVCCLKKRHMSFKLYLKLEKYFAEVLKLLQFCVE